MKSTNQITLYDLMAEDMDVWLIKRATKRFNLQIDNENGDTVVDECEIHPFAIEGLARFCRNYLNTFDNATQRFEKGVIKC